MKRDCVPSLVLAFALGATSLAAHAEDVASALAECRAQASETDRLACYDKLANRVSPPAAASPAIAEAPPAQPAPERRAHAATEPGSPPQGATLPAPEKSASGSQASAATTGSGSREFGYRGGALARADAEREAAAEARAKEGGEEAEEIIGTVTEVARRPRGELVVTLDNGQTWLQKTADATFMVKYGDRVRVEAGKLGAYIMYRGDSKRGTRVTRIR